MESGTHGLFWACGIICGMRLLLLAIVSLLVGCAPSSTTRLVFETRDRETEVPVADAVVAMEPVHLFLPMNSAVAANQIVDPTPTASTRGRTDATGAAILDVVVTHPVAVTVIAPGYAPLQMTLEVFPAAGDVPTEFRIEGVDYDGTWYDPDAATPDAVEPRRLEVRLSGP